MHKFFIKPSVTAHYNIQKSEIGPFYRTIFSSWMKLLLNYSIFHIIGELSPTFDKIFAKNKMHLLFKRKSYSKSNINFQIAFTNCDCVHRTNFGQMVDQKNQTTLNMLLRGQSRKLSINLFLCILVDSIYCYYPSTHCIHVLTNDNVQKYIMKRSYWLNKLVINMDNILEFGQIINIQSNTKVTL